MPLVGSIARRARWVALVFCAGSLMLKAAAQESPSFSPAPIERGQVSTTKEADPVPRLRTAPARREAPEAATLPKPAPPPSPHMITPPNSHFDKAMFLKPLAPDQLAFLKQFEGMPSSDLLRDKQARKLLHTVLPDCMFHYGSDMPLEHALETVFDNSHEPVTIRDGRYLIASGARGPYLAGRGFLWIDLQDGIGLGGFFFHPTNGEPTPSLAVFSRQVKEDVLSMSDLPPAFAQSLSDWADRSSVPAVETTYFLTGTNKRVLLEHDEDFCSPANGVFASGSGDCEQMNADAADLDLNAAYYLDQVHFATNATAWMIGPEQTAFLRLRERTCGGVADPLGCRIRVTRERVHVVVHRLPPHR